LVSLLDEAITLAESADYFAVIGTSQSPAAGLIDFTPQTPIFILIKAYKIQISEIHWRLFLKWLKGVEIMRKNLLHKCNGNGNS
jgi:hypothetical protein